MGRTLIISLALLLLLSHTMLSPAALLICLIDRSWPTAPLRGFSQLGTYGGSILLFQR